MIGRNINVNDKKDTTLVNKFGGWERLVIFSTVVISVPLFALLGTAVVALVHEREGAMVGITLSGAALLILWALSWGALWIISGIRSGTIVPPLSSAAELSELRRENTMLKELLAERSRQSDDSG